VIELCFMLKVRAVLFFVLVWALRLFCCFWQGCMG
jgi:hypothetical protein